MSTLTKINNLTRSLDSLESIYAELYWMYESENAPRLFIEMLIALEDHMLKTYNKIQVLTYGTK